jgi:peptidoglycan/xylan/chitin deacetylase (PgdA/CDA1 family)
MPPPDYPTVTHREYGHRIGIYRLFELFDAYAIRATAAIDALTAERYPLLVSECVRRGWEIMAHGVGQRRAITASMSEADERVYIRSALDAIGRAAGTRPSGWLSPEQSESTRTPALLAEMGVEYLCDWANDDQPYLIGAGEQSLVSLPLMQDISDVNLHWHRRVMMAQWSAVVCEAFDTLYREGRDGGRLFALPLHPWCIGQPFRVRYLEQVLAHMHKHREVWAATGAEIAAWYRRSLVATGHRQ